MRTITALVFCAVFTALPSAFLNGQIQLGIKAGISPANNLGMDHVVVNGSSTAMTFNTIRTGNEIYGGLVARKSLKDNFFVQSELLYNYQSNDYMINYLDNDAPNFHASDATHQLILPVSIGVRIGNFEVTSGLTTRYYMKQSSDLSDLSNYVQDLSRFSLGYHSGIGYNFSVIRLELSYQMDFNNYGADMFINGKELQLSNARNRLIASAAYMF